ncbi:hypothetical protein Droror1_Dr00009737 [Drosera rotundifolia]
MDDSVDRWRDYFKTSNSDVVEIIDKTIIVATVDCPKKLWARGGRLAELSFSGCFHVVVICKLDFKYVVYQLSPRVKGEEAAEMMMSLNESLKSDVDDSVCCNKTKFSCIRDDKANWDPHGYGELEALTSKDVLRNFEVFADEETEIGKAVNSLRKHESKRIQHLVRELICGWRLVGNEYVKTAEPLSGIVLSDPEDNNGEFNKSQESRKPPEPKQIIAKWQEQPVKGQSDLTKETPCPQIKKHETIMKTVKANEESVSRKPIKPNGLLKLDNEAKIPTKSDMSAVQRKPAPSTEKPKVADEDAYKLKLEATKRKLHERYQKAEIAKRQRTIQIVQVKAIPVQGAGQNNTHGRFATNGIRQLGSRCRYMCGSSFFDMVEGFPASPSSSDRKFISR